MTPQSGEAIAFGRPGGESCAPSRARPVDLVHLARQTLGDRAGEQEGRGMLMNPQAATHDRLATPDEEERRMLAHGLKGSARGIGAFAVADCAGEIEDSPGSKALIARLSSLIDEVREFISAISR